MNSIPFLRLPLLVIQDVLSMMIPFEIILLAQASKRSQRILKACLNTERNKKYHLDVIIREDYGTGIKSSAYSWYYLYSSKINTPNYIFNGNRKKYGPSISSAQKLTSNKLDDFQRICDLCQDIFGNIEGIDMDLDYAENPEIIDYLKSKQGSFSWLDVCSSRERGDQIKHLLENLNITENLYISAQIPEDLEVNLPENVENLHFQHSKFIKLEQLLALNSKRIVLGSTKFTKQDISAILKSWRASESNLDLEQLKIAFYSTSQQIENILHDIPNEIGDEFQVNDGSGKLISVPRGNDIKRRDGKKARVIFWRLLEVITLDMYIH